jgi:TonB family protein
MKPNRVWLFLKTSIIACSLVFSLTSAAICRQQETADQSIEKVKKAIENDEWGRAQSGIRRALGLKPDSAEANVIAAQVYWQEGARSMAIEALDKAIRNQPVYPEAHFLLAQYLIESGKLEKAREEANIAIGQSTPLFPAYRLLGQIDFEEGRLEAAVASFETALRLSRTGDEKEAAELQQQLRDLREFIKLFPSLEAEQNAPDVVRPVALNSPTPRYTDEARALKVQGIVSMAILVTEYGDVDSVLLFRRLGHGLDEQATEMAHKLKFSPANKSGKPIPYWQKLTVEFNLK